MKRKIFTMALALATTLVANAIPAKRGSLRVCWRLGVRLDRCLKAGQLAAVTLERPLLYRLAGASRVVLYPAGL